MQGELDKIEAINSMQIQIQNLVDVKGKGSFRNCFPA